MKRHKPQKRLLQVTLFLNILIIIPLFLRKRPFKDWIIVYLFNAFTNAIADNVLSKKKIVKYPVNLFPKIFDTHVLFDYFLYPTFTILYNQWTMKDKIFPTIFKLFLMATPAFFIEFLAERKTDLVDWSKKWKWYHSYLSIILKSLSTRLIIGIVRWVEEK
jgi:hypothetical protein